MLVKLFIRDRVCVCVCVCWKDFVVGGVIVPFPHNLLGFRVVQRGECVVGELAKEVPGAVDFKGIELAVGSHVIQCVLLL